MPVVESKLLELGCLAKLGATKSADRTASADDKVVEYDPALAGMTPPVGVTEDVLL